MSGATSGLATTCDTAEKVNSNVVNKAIKSRRLPIVPDVDNRRFCRVCQDMLPVELFPAGTRRYVCRRHLWERVQLPSKMRMLTDPRKKLLWVIWKRCWVDAKIIFRQPRISLLQEDILSILTEKMPDALEELPAELNSLSLMPADPSIKLSCKNMVLVPPTLRKTLLKARRDGGQALYLKKLASWRDAAK